MKETDLQVSLDEWLVGGMRSEGAAPSQNVKNLLPTLTCGAAQAFVTAHP